ncbi:MAG: hypothetical protein RLZZ488_1201 [Pseudomonadota bacterium]
MLFAFFAAGLALGYVFQKDVIVYEQRGLPMAKRVSTLPVSQPAAILGAGEKTDLLTWACEKLTANITDVVGHFLLAQRSAHTRSAYKRDILEFLDFMHSLGRTPLLVGDICERSILLWKDELSRRHTRFSDTKRRIANSSVARKLCTLSSLLDFALKRKLIEENPLMRVNRPKVRRQSHASVLSADELMQILNASREHLQGIRISAPAEVSALALWQRKLRAAEMEWCILVLLFTVGMRVSELCQLTIKDLIPDGDLLRLRLVTKGARKHVPLIHPESAKILMSFVERHRGQAAPDEPVFPAGRNNSIDERVPLHRSTVFRMVRQAAIRAGIQRNFSPHGCRATLATQLHLEEVPVVEIQSLLNHAQVTTTQLYLHRVDALKESAALRLPWVNSSHTKDGE